MATLGDPLADLGLLIVYQSLAAHGQFGLAPLRPADGFRTVDELVERYRGGTERSLGRLNWYVSFAYFKLAVISEGILHRHLAGQTVGEGFDQVGESVPALLEAALESLAADTSL
jgi:aminoglycoside phosphotransferase (APT) family kinase protein